uniref:CD99 antigen-like n=1 Tax=Phascolarctos cinereus TaxID=38626 RepID=A0A6P5KUE1_PHACI|nr:CD99 antigen-like [Phascolarctos cinereus]
MVVGRWPGISLLLVLLVCSLAPARGDFDLSDALPDEKPTKKPIPATKKPQPDSGLSLEDALLNGGDDDSVKPNPPKPKPANMVTRVALQMMISKGMPTQEVLMIEAMTRTHLLIPLA